MYFQAAGWSCTWDLKSLHYINAGLQVWTCNAGIQVWTLWVLYLANMGWSFTFFSLSCRMAHFWCLICAKLLGQLIPWMVWHAIQCIWQTHFYIVQLLLPVLVLYYLLHRFVCISGTLMVLKNSRPVSMLVLYKSALSLSYLDKFLNPWYPFIIHFDLHLGLDQNGLLIDAFKNFLYLIFFPMFLNHCPFWCF